MARSSSIRSLWSRSTLLSMVLLVVVVALVSVSLARFSPTAAAPRLEAEQDTEALWARIDAYVEGERQAAQVPGIALGIVQGDQVVHMQGFGEADPSGRPVTPQTPFHIGSVAKSMTAMAIMQLVEQGKLDLDAAIQDYLPWFTLADPAARVTVRHLLTHTSGLPRQVGLQVAQNRADTGDGALERQVRAWNSVELATAPGTAFQYNNANYVLLGLLIETRSGQTFEQYLQQHILTPLAMHNSTVGTIVDMPRDPAMGYRYWFGVPRAADINYGRVINPAGGVLASAEDMTHYLVAQLNGGRYGEVQVTAPATIKAAQQAAFTIPADAPHAAGFDEAAYGLGWITGTRQGVPVVSHPGDLPTYHADVLLLPQEQVGIVLLMNANNRLSSERMRAIVHGVTSLMLEREPAPVETDGGVGLLLFRIVLGLALVQVVVIAWSARTLRRWARNVTERPRGVWRLIWHVVLPLIFHLLLALLFLIGLPLVFNLPFALLMESTPDIGTLAIISGIIALVWSILRTVIVYRLLRGRRVAPSPHVAMPAA